MTKRDAPLSLISRRHALWKKLSKGVVCSDDSVHERVLRDGREFFGGGVMSNRDFRRWQDALPSLKSCFHSSVTVEGGV